MSELEFLWKCENEFYYNNFHKSELYVVFIILCAQLTGKSYKDKEQLFCRQVIGSEILDPLCIIFSWSIPSYHLEMNEMKPTKKELLLCMKESNCLTWFHHKLTTIISSYLIMGSMLPRIKKNKKKLLILVLYLPSQFTVGMRSTIGIF